MITTDDRSGPCDNPLGMALLPVDGWPSTRDLQDGMARRLRQAREALGLRQSDMARALGVSAPKQSEYESGVYKLPLTYQWRLNHIYGITPSWLLIGEMKDLPPKLRERLAAR